MSNHHPLRISIWKFILPVYCVFLLSGVTKGSEFGQDKSYPNLNQDASATTQPTLRESYESIQSAPLSSPPENPEGPLFKELEADQTGVSFVNRYPLDSQVQFSMMEGVFGVGGVCIGDYDGDGQADIYITSAQQSNRLYRNLGNFRFEDVTGAAGVGADELWSTGASFVDIDNDGDLDLYLCAYHETNRLFVNQGDGTFQDATEASRLNSTQANIMMSFEDYDGDGDMDAYLVTNRSSHLHPKGTRFQRFPDGRVEVKPEFRQLYMILQFPDGSISPSMDGQNDRLFRNDGDGTFSDVTAAAGLTGYAPGLAATWWDYNDDGRADLFVSNDFKKPDRLYHNNGDGTFTDVIRDALPHLSWFSMGSDAADINNDGRLDFMSSDMSGTSHFRQKVAMGAMGQSAPFLKYADPQQYMRNALFVSTGTERFFEAAYLAGLANSNWTWSVKLGDLDNDGWVDAFFTNGSTRDWIHSDSRAKREALTGVDEEAKALYWKNAPKNAEQNLAFRNLGNLAFEDSSESWGLDNVGISYGAALGDLDRDGALALVINTFDDAPLVYRNQSIGHRLLIRLIGSQSNRYGIGAKVTIETEAGISTRRLHLASGFMSANEPLVQFGTGEISEIKLLSVFWPSGHRQTFEHLATDRFYTITEPPGPPKQGLGPVNQPLNQQSAPLFQKADDLGLDQAVHHDRPYDDFVRQPLLPSKLSQLGPGLALGDVDGDGDEDLYLSGAAGQPGQLYLRGKAGRFVDSNELNMTQPFAEDAESEDMAPLLFDADGDGDLDLLVVSGGVECEPESNVLRDRLYLGDGHGLFSRATDALPDLRDSGSAVCAADFDRDGDLDLFIGGRVIPGQYPRTPKSRLLVNNGNGEFADATQALAPELLETGLVTSAIWSDVDDDGWIDLLVTHEWGPVKLFRNTHGRLDDGTHEAGLAERSGWWNGISAGDIDRDGDMDYVTTNVGLNTKYHATREKPTLLYYGDFNESGQNCLVEADYEGDHLYPMRGKSCSTKAIPSLAEKFPSYSEFASALLPEIYTPRALSGSLKLEANTLESGLWINDGQGHFTFQALPRLAQISPSFGAALVDVDGDGNLDLYLVQNSFSPQPETGHMDGGVSLLLKGMGKREDEVGFFAPVWPCDSGLVVPEDAKGLATCDLNGDYWPDFLVSTNNGKLVPFINRAPSINQGTKGHRLVALRLVGRPGNPTGVGARVTLKTTEGHSLVLEVAAGGSYLSQSSAKLFYGLGPHDDIETIEVRWASGQAEVHAEGHFNKKLITLQEY